MAWSAKYTTERKHVGKTELPTMRDVLAASQVLRLHLPRTPLYRYETLGQELSSEVFVKHENHLPTGSFKVRGGINLVSRLLSSERSRGVITASTGNHAQSIAYASKIFGGKAVIVMPENPNPLKVQATRALGAEVILHGRDFDAAKEYAARLGQEKQYRFIHPANEPLLIAGVATYTLEIFEDLPNVDVIIVPVGGGSGASGACIVAKAINPDAKVIAVQSERAPAQYMSWKENKLVSAKNETFAEGLQTGQGYQLTQSILHRYLDDFVLVSEDDIRESMLTLMTCTHNLVEGASAASLAGARKIKRRLKNKNVALIVSGGNVGLRDIIDLYERRK